MQQWIKSQGTCKAFPSIKRKDNEKMSEISELAKIIDNKLTTLHSDDILAVAFLPAENIYLLKTLKEFMYKSSNHINEIGAFTIANTYTEILRTLDNAIELFKFN